mmetsp:Transcript_6203/g.16174  ORF Transcript_6203/g.16174 Transcript_6203/m.16174 type:complete len:284 (-) Transcript_6203:524-1375(-)|eukprot:CAMPEP_0197414790 /NCGR_PEP_ID=MMETSP1170-20131217/1474_1 /TAXON_ID=54406 /ORGANISM="Sarcinochrysis sp, Strain CCMP770" /LENGTH=283 /DNA_ID=CAMNT_0042941541 /DNA_START=75 /DNA_END=926 /DNA_ORIENTATION=-
MILTTRLLKSMVFIVAVGEAMDLLIAESDTIVIGSSAYDGQPMSLILGNDRIYTNDKFDLKSFSIDAPNVVATSTSNTLTFSWDNDYELSGGGTDVATPTLIIHTGGASEGTFDLYDAIAKDHVEYTICLKKNSGVCSTATISMLEGFLQPQGGYSFDSPLRLFYASTNDRDSNSANFDVAGVQDTSTFSGDVYFFIYADFFDGGEDCIDFVHFCFDFGIAGCQTERFDPYDAAGGSVATANPFDTTQVSNGEHYISMVVKFSDEDSCGDYTLRYDFTFQVDN